jgi:ankyrin repeat protein/tetratricopeptide (TPR) repeat protein
MGTFRAVSCALLFFLLAGVPVESDTSTSLFTSIRNDDLTEVKKQIDADPVLLTTTDDNEMTPLMYAAYYGVAPVVEYLIGRGADVNYRRSNGDTPLHFAANFNHAGIVELLIESGADVNAQTNNRATPLRSAINGGAKEAAAILMAHEAEVPADGELFHTAASKGMDGIVAKMVEMGVEPDPDDGDGGTILHSAAAGGLVELSRRALAGGLDVNATNRYGTAPIHLAAAGGHVEEAAYLLDNGADINMKMFDGATPWHLANAAGNDELTGMLASRGADAREVWHMDVAGDVYLGQERPGLQPRLFAVGIVSTEDWSHGAPAISPLGDEIYWAKNFRTTYSIENDGDRGWTLPGAAPLWTEYGATNPAFSSGADRLFFSSTSTMAGDDTKRDSDIWFVERTVDGWGKPENLGPNVNTTGRELLLSVTREGTLYFTSDYDIYRSQWADGSYHPRERLGEAVNTDAIEMSPCVAPDERYLIFEAINRGGFAETELYVCFRGADGAWSEAKNMGYAINRGGARFPGLSPDGEYLFFTSLRTGNSDVYWVDARIVETIREAEYSDISAALYTAVIEGGIEAADKLYRRLKANNPDYYDFRESMLNGLGYRLLGEEQFAEAIGVFRLNVEMFPESGNVYDSLGEAYMKNGDSELAVTNYRNSLEHNPGNDNARAMLEKIERKTVTKVSAAGLTFERSPQNFYPRSTNDVSLGDIDADGDLDVVCSNMARNYSRVWFNDGAGRLTQSDQELTMQGHGVELADLDGDDDLDIFITCAGFGDGRNDYDERTRIYLNDGHGVFTDSGQDLNDLELSGTGVKLADVDSDGDLDALVNYYQHDNIIYLNDGNARFTKSDKTFPGAATIGDLDGDGDPDYFAKAVGKGYRTALNDGSGNFIDHWDFDDPETRRAGDARLGDFDGDGDFDAVVANGSWRGEAMPSKLFLNDGTGSFVDSGIELPAVKNAGMDVGDLNDDGFLDVVVTDFEMPNQIWLGTENGGLVDSGIRLSFGEMFRHICIGDLDGDGDVDIFFANFNRPGQGGPNEIWFNRGAPTGGSR